MLDLTSLAVYGSVARGTASNNSDIDLLVVSQSFNGSLAERIDMLVEVRFALRRDLKMLSGHGFNTFLSFYPLRMEEVERRPIILLDLVEDSRIVYDKNGFLQKNLTRLRLKLAELGAKRIFKDDKWYWDLKPDYRKTEAVSI